MMRRRVLDGLKRRARALFGEFYVINVGHVGVLKSNTGNGTVAHPARVSAPIGHSRSLKDLRCFSRSTPKIYPFKVWDLEMFGRVQRDILGLCQ